MQEVFKLQKLLYTSLSDSNNALANKITGVYYRVPRYAAFPYISMVNSALVPSKSTTGTISKITYEISVFSDSINNLEVISLTQDVKDIVAKLEGSKFDGYKIIYIEMLSVAFENLESLKDKWCGKLKFEFVVTAI